MKKNMYFMLTMTFILSVNLFANPAAIDFNKLSKDSKLKELSNDFLKAVYGKNYARCNIWSKV